ncbi:MAG: hypothetical protein LUD18_06310 [Lachnospiraceae bacterium]|nr:hypothetical protein [Lachnospiraceae bacterium]
MEYSLEGKWQVRLMGAEDQTERELCHEMILPGTLDENRIGYRDTGKNQWHMEETNDEENDHPAKKNVEASGLESAPKEHKPIATRFTRKYTYEGEARLTRRVHFTEKPGKRVFLEAERARVLSLLIDGQEVLHALPPSISTPQVFEVTGKVDGTHEITLLSDNSYPGLPREQIIYSSAATDETQTNWNGVLGYLRLSEENEVFLRGVRIYPKMTGDGTLSTKNSQKTVLASTGQMPIGEQTSRWAASIIIGMDAGRVFEGTLRLCSNAFTTEVVIPVSLPAGCTEIVVEIVSAGTAHRAVVSFDGVDLAGAGTDGRAVSADADGISETGRSSDNTAGRYAVLKPELCLWDEDEGNLYELTAQLFADEGAAKAAGEDDGKTAQSNHAFAQMEALSEKTVRFGFRVFRDNGRGRLALNGRTIFLRGEANCAEFPEEGHPPMDKTAWLEILGRYHSYGVNCMRFHSHCPPEAAFEAADELGMLMQPELSHWDPKSAFETEESFAYYQRELTQILKMLANHPSFVMLTLGNELWTRETGLARMHQLLALARKMDDTRLYAIASNGFYGMEGCDAESDFYTSQRFYGMPLRGTSAAEKKEEGIQGHINHRYPDSCMNYDTTMEELRKTYAKPVFGFEVGQFEVLSDFEELSDFHGISSPANLELIREKAAARGLLEEWNRYVEATGELALIGYREEVEAAMRTREMSGLSLLGLQDFPGQGTALVGMMNSHLQPKPYSFASPERFQAFFRSQLVLAEFPGYTYESTECLQVRVKVANFGKQEICAPVRYELRWATVEETVCAAGTAPARTPSPIEIASRWAMAGELPQVTCPVGELTDAGEFTVSLSFAEAVCAAEEAARAIEEMARAVDTAPARTLQNEIASRQAAAADRPMRLSLYVQVGAAENTYPIWVYPPVEPVCPDAVYETEVYDSKTRRVLAEGGIVYLTPLATAEAMPSSIKTQFTTDFWSVGTFPAQEGGMGQLIDEKHPLFVNFPTEFHTNWQWWPMATQRAIILPEYKKSIVAQMDSYAYMRPMTQLLECRCGGGRLLLSSMALQNLQQYPEARALQNAIYQYLVSEQFCPEQEMEAEVLADLVWKGK